MKNKYFYFINIKFEQKIAFISLKRYTPLSVIKEKIIHYTVYMCYAVKYRL